MAEKTLREMREELEESMLSPYAAKAAKCTRRYPDEKCPVRTEFQRDRDRVLYSKAFRRLMHKTQVFIAPEGDHYRTRLTHTLEVSQIARTIARALRLNEDLTEAISLGHDLGHAPFGHAGESSLNSLMIKYGHDGFHHSLQSLRVVDFLERENGLNLTNEVRNGIVAHTKGKGDLKSKGVFTEPKTLEAAVVRIADRLAYINHDIDDAIRAKIISTNDIPADLRDLFGTGISQRVHVMVMDIVQSSWEKPAITMSDAVNEGLDRLKNFMFERVYTNSPAKAEEEKTNTLIEHLFDYLMNHPEIIPHYIVKAEPNGHLDWEPIEYSRAGKNGPKVEFIDMEDRKWRARAVCDFIAGMTDRYAIALHNRLFVPQGWNLEVICKYDPA